MVLRVNNTNRLPVQELQIVTIVSHVASNKSFALEWIEEVILQHCELPQLDVDPSLLYYCVLSAILPLSVIQNFAGGV